MNRHSTRREFLKRSAAAGAGLCFAGTCAVAGVRSPNEKLNIGIIGVHSRGAANMASVAGEHIGALCDVDANYLAEAAKKYPEAKTYADWRKMVDQKDLDAVVVSTTEHTHALASVWAMKRGKHVYCEKPLAHNVYEARVMRQTSQQMNQEWIHACKTGAPTLCNFDYSGALIEHNLLGTVVFRTGKKLEWDPEKLKATNCPEADRFIRRSYREGWTLA
jgi:hypothetical protein